MHGTLHLQLTPVEVEWYEGGDEITCFHCRQCRRPTNVTGDDRLLNSRFDPVFRTAEDPRLATLLQKIAIVHASHLPGKRNKWFEWIVALRLRTIHVIYDGIVTRNYSCQFHLYSLFELHLKHDHDFGTDCMTSLLKRLRVLPCFDA